MYKVDFPHFTPAVFIVFFILPFWNQFSLKYNFRSSKRSKRVFSSYPDFSLQILSIYLKLYQELLSKGQLFSLSFSLQIFPPPKKKRFLFFRHIYRPYLLAWSHVFRLHCYLTGKMFLRKQVPDTKREVMQWHLHWRTVIFLKKK